jgi:hypothetical protein
VTGPRPLPVKKPGEQAGEREGSEPLARAAKAARGAPRASVGRADPAAQRRALRKVTARQAGRRPTTARTPLP